QLHHAERIAPQLQAHGLLIDRDRLGVCEKAFGQVAHMQVIGQGPPPKLHVAPPYIARDLRRTGADA
ncbi:MAG: hypothetical protein ACREEO_00610, partial [Phenylobacterium sp.]